MPTKQIDWIELYYRAEIDAERERQSQLRKRRSMAYADMIHYDKARRAIVATPVSKRPANAVDIIASFYAARSLWNKLHKGA